MNTHSLDATSPASAQADTEQQFLNDVIAGLTAVPKYLNSKYFYDSIGDKLFQELMSCDEYYPTNCEMEIFTRQTARLAQAMIGDGDGFDLIELGAGDAAKSSHLLKYLLEQEADLTYLPIDISENVISYLNITLPVTLPGIKIEGLQGEYFDMLKKAAARSDRRKVVMFLGSNIGNMPVEDAAGFAKELRAHLSEGDMVLVGVDLKKNPKTVLAAYNDKEGITKRFNLNLLERMNRELGANFITSQFEHYPTYDPQTGACKSYLISLSDQQVNVGGKVIAFKKDEYIYMEISQKYALDEVQTMATKAGFNTAAVFYDSKHWFVDAVWVAE